MYYDLVLHIDDNDPKRMNLALNNYANTAAALPEEEFKVVLLVNGPAAQLLKRDQAELAAKAAGFMANGLSIRVCRNALKAFDVKPEDLWEGVEIVPAGMVELIRLQREGFAYIKP